MNAWIRIPLRILSLFAALAVVMVAVLTGGYFYVEPTVPAAASLREVPFQVPLTIYTRDIRLIDVRGADRRDPVPYEQIPERIKQAFLAAEDDRFFEHSGVDYAGIVRGALFATRNLLTGRNERVPGGSTITQQVSRTAQLVGREYDPARKFREILLAYRIEDEFTKEEIFNLFLNTTFFGQRANGVAAAAQTYFNKSLNELTLGEIAIIAGIPQGPSIMNPYNGPENAARRRSYVLGRMLEEGMITPAEREAALAEPIVAQVFDPQIEVAAPYAAEMAYAWCLARIGKSICDTAGLKIVTTIDSRLQAGGTLAARAALEAYDRRHGYRGAVARIDLATLGFVVPEPELEGAADAGGGVEGDSADGVADADAAAEVVRVVRVDAAAVPAAALDTLLADYPVRYETEAAVVLGAGDLSADVYLRSAGLVTLGVEAIDWARPYISDNQQGTYPELASDVLAPGDIVRLRRTDTGSFEMVQVPDGLYPYIDGAVVSLDPMDGAIVTLVGGYSFQPGINEFNRATQALRQPGSSFKPFFYASALDRGYTLATVVNDVCDRYFDATLEREHCVQNYEGRYHGEMPLRQAFFRSLNAPADRIIRDIGASYVANYVERFGFDPATRERNASLALGSLLVTPLELASAYAMLANGGHAVGIRPASGGAPEPYLVQRVETAAGELVYDASLSVERVCAPLGFDVVDDLPAGLVADRQIGRPGAPSAGLIEDASQLFPWPLRCAEQVESPQRIFLIKTVLKEVVQPPGSGQRAGLAFPGRRDLFGKTGTTNDARDAWFAGGNADIVAVTWVGFDDVNRELGNGEQGGRTAIPAWVDFMKVALDGMPGADLPRPPGIVELRVVPETGLIAADCRRNAPFEYFVEQTVPPREPDTICFGASGLPRTLEPGIDTGAPGSDAGSEPGSGETLTRPPGPGRLFN